MKFLSLVFITIIFVINVNASEKEDLLKGVILERISQFITYKDDGDDFSLCIYKNRDMTDIFKDLFKTRKYKGKSIQIKSIYSLDELGGCDIFYVENLKSTLKRELLSKKQPYTLLATNDIELLDEGFMLALYLQKNRIRFAINHGALLDANLKINYRLLKVASKVVNPVKN